MPKSTKQRPLATIRRPVKAKIYRGKFRPFAATKYLNLAALRRASKAAVEIGTVEAPGVSITLVAEVRKGMIVKVRPLPCVGCKRRPLGKARLKRTLTEVTKRVEALGQPQPRLPMALTESGGSWGGTFGPITIIIDEGIPCIWIYVGDTVCVICAFDVIQGICL
jgi:hypothetical protein